MLDIALYMTDHMSRRGLWRSVSPLDLKLVSVKLAACGFPLPTFNFVFYEYRQLNAHINTSTLKGNLTLKSFAFSFFFLLLDPILTLLQSLPGLLRVTHGLKGRISKLIELCRPTPPR